MRLFDVTRATQLMAEHGVDLTLASAKDSVGYLSDYWDDDTREDYAMWYSEVRYVNLCGVAGDASVPPFLVLSAHEKTSVEARACWIADRRYWGPGFYVQQWPSPRPAPGDPMQTVAQAIDDRGLARGCIAIEPKHLATEYFARLTALLPDATWTDAGPILAKLRAVKCAEEVDRLREVCARTVRAWQAAIGELRPGMTELQLRWEIGEAFAAQQLGWDRGYVIFGPAGVHLQHGAPVPGSNALRAGQFVRVDIAGRYRGYLSDMSRVVGFGTLSAEMEHAHAVVRGILDELTALVRPGLTGGELRQRELALYAAAGVKPVVPYAAHCIGRTVHEAPYASQDDNTPFEPGMVIALEPTVTFSRGGDFNICLEDDLLVTTTGCERLTGAASLDLYL
jgi:Xaa-Pro aminopeptidase